MPAVTAGLALLIRLGASEVPGRTRFLDSEAARPGAGPNQLVGPATGRVMLIGLQSQGGDGEPDQVLVLVPNAQSGEAAVQGGGVVRQGAVLDEPTEFADLLKRGSRHA
ncbi:hypothetical protein ABZX90_10590 [Streptomyces sp. NPDC002935]|uniref:hypothetical protein n=1 Tax=unclassified Streptomyces TaxID=2593676 RepID=UPI0033256C27